MMEIIGGLLLGLLAAIAGWWLERSKRAAAEDRAKRAKGERDAHRRVDEEAASRDRSDDARDKRLRDAGLLD